ncbi:hypothetical protein AOXY_G5032 [Acipenser oxyrinchus oxyrinchus]|uniref:Uncharacterized protein n=1 Tax=Acipenser oxyrinchus oxyrinchus TaxID=40147 RepID=A0AAD8LR74_ACIOX|nr:hypothetical protein AOXY_G5032 [Acipenser oxyrinchus oxyrinchus]
MHCITLFLFLSVSSITGLTLLKIMYRKGHTLYKLQKGMRRLQGFQNKPTIGAIHRLKAWTHQHFASPSVTLISWISMYPHTLGWGWPTLVLESHSPAGFIG